MPARKRRSLEDISHVFQQFLYYRAQSSVAGKEQKKLGDKLKDYCRTHGVVQKDAEDQEISGNIEYVLDEPAYVGDKVFTGFELRKQQDDPVFSDEAALALATDKGLLDDAGTRIIRLNERDFRGIAAVLSKISRGMTWDSFGAELSFDIDQNAFYRMYQQGKITEAEVDSLLVDPKDDENYKPRYSFWPTEGKEVLDGEEAG